METMKSGSTETYSDISTYTTGSHYDIMRHKVLEMTELILEQRIADGSRLISICDYGTADGVNVFPLLLEIIDLIDKKSNGTMQTMIYLNDQINNNFNLLHANIDQSEFKKKRKTFVSVIGRSMYEQCLPCGCLDMALSSFAVHWLSEIPCTIENGLCSIHGTDTERVMFKEQAEKDWKNFILSRGHEMKSGGFMVILVSMTETHELGRAFMSCLSDIWRKMYSEEKINKEEFRNTVLPVYTERTEKDVRCIFDDPEMNNSGLQIASIKEKKYEMKPLIQIRNIHGNAAYAEAVVNYTRPWLTSFIDHGLSETRLSHEKEQIIEEYFHKLKTFVVEEHLKLDFFVFQEVVVTKS